MSAIEADGRGLVMSCPQCGRRNRVAYERLGHSFRCGQCHLELRAPGETIEVKTEAAFDAMCERSAIAVLVDFWAPWCGPCKMVAPELAKVAADGAGRWLVVKVNTDELPSLAQRFHISGIPTLALFESGRELARRAGALPSAAIHQFLEQVEASRT